MENTHSSQIFGNYILKRKLGAGGMASVFHAVHSESKEEVALKILHEHYSDDSYIRKRLEHEARIVMRLEHPHIVPVLDYGEADRRPYLVMPYMSGGSLAQYFSKPRTVKHETTLKLLAVLASALDYAHSQEVVHRDFKLENILLGANGLPAISDFGIAQSAHTTRITLTGQILGTPQYLAPEAIDNDGVLNYKADFYALGIMAYLMLTGYFPFTALDPLSLALKHRTETAPLASLVNPNLPTTLDAIFIRALAKNPDERYETAKAFVDALEGAFTHAALVTTQIFVNSLNPVPATQILPTQPGLAPTVSAAQPKNLQTIDLSGETIPAVHSEAAPASKAKEGFKLPVYLNFLMIFLCTGAALAYLTFSGGINMNLPLLQAESTAENTLESFANVSEEITEESLSLETDEEEVQAVDYFSLIRGSQTQQSTIRSSATSTSRPSSTSRARSTATSRPNNNQNPVSTATSRPINTTAPLATDTPRPLPSNTPQPPTSVPPTSVPPTSIPPTAVPPTSVPPTSIPPTAVPPTSVPPTNPPPPPPTQILDPILNPVNTIVPCVPIPLVRTC